MVRELTIIAAAALIIASLAAHAQSTPSKLTYRCVGKDGKKYYGSTIPPQCLGQPVEQLNTQGTVIRRFDPEGDEKQKAAKEAEAAKPVPAPAPATPQPIPASQAQPPK